MGRLVDGLKTLNSLDELFGMVNELIAANPRDLRPVAWIIDLDSTVFYVGRRTQHIFFDYLRETQNKDPLYHWLAANLDHDNPAYYIEDWFYNSLIKRDSRLARNWAIEIWKNFEPFWYKGFFSNRYLIYDVPFKGAVELMQRIAALGHNILFLTGRDHKRMGIGTIQSLRHAGLWQINQTRLIMKSDVNEEDYFYKTRMCKLLAEQYNVVVAMDNEIELVAGLRRVLPKSLVVFFETVMSQRVPKPEDLSMLPGLWVYRPLG